MNLTSLTIDTIRGYIPNVLAEVEGETTLFDKLSTWIDSSCVWIEDNYLGPDDFLDEDDNQIALRIVVTKAFADAVPSLDLVVTPTGFGVISTESLAPASKERVERLVKSLRDYVDLQLTLLIRKCHGYPEWYSTKPGRYFCSTFLSYREDRNILPESTFDDIHRKAMQVEGLMAELYLGIDLMRTVRYDYNIRNPFPDGDPEYVQRIFRNAVAALVAQNRTPAKSDIWNACRPLVEALDRCPHYKEIWQETMGHRFNVDPFKNDIKGSFYF